MQVPDFVTVGQRLRPLSSPGDSGGRAHSCEKQALEDFLPGAEPRPGRAAELSGFHSVSQPRRTRPAPVSSLSWPSPKATAPLPAKPGQVRLHGMLGKWGATVPAAVAHGGVVLASWWVPSQHRGSIL